MTLDPTRYHDSKTFVKPRPHAFYPLRIPLQHYQLRHFISASEDGRIYYAAQDEVFALHVATGKRERIATLAFNAQCLGAAFGWVCVGGQTGKCVFIDVRERSAGVDELLPLNLDPNARPGDEPNDYGAHRPIRPRAYPHSVSTDYINSIALFRIASEEKGIDDEEVALIATNDHSVEIFSLRQLKVIKTLTFPVNMNHASLSPHGHLMIACGDSARAYFLKRVRLPGHTVDGEFCYAKYEWKVFDSVGLNATEFGDTCFSTAFSPSGHICTVASQFGVMTVFDVSRIRDGMDDDDAVIDWFTSSRPAPVEEIGVWMPGAVRSSAFSPEPWDLFAWAEDRGRVCIADLRDGFRTRQLIELDPSSSDLERCEISEVEDQSIAELRELEIEASMLQRHRSFLAARDDLAALQQNTDFVENAAERRRRRELASNVWTSSSTDLTETERQILETLRVERLQDAANSQNDDRSPFSVHYSSYAGSGSSRGYNPQMSVRQYIANRERTAANRDSGSQASSSARHGPRRRSSVVISSTRAAAEAASSDQPSASSSAHPSSLLPITSTPTLSTSPSRLATATSAQSSTRDSSTSPESTPSTSTSDQAWRTISAAMASAGSGGSSSSTAPPLPSTNSDDTRRTRTVREVQRQLRAAASTSSEDRPRASSRQRELDEARAQVLALSSAALERDADSTLDDGAEASSTASRAAALRLQRERTRRQQVEQLLAEYHALQRQGLEAQERSQEIRESWTRAERGLDQVRLQQLQRLQERAQLAEERLPGVGAPAGLGEPGIGAPLAYARAGRSEQGVAVMGLGWSGDGRTLFVGTEEGIFLYKLNTHARKCFPAVCPR